MIDIYCYIISPDVAAHCREIGKAWTPFDMAIIVSRSYRTVTENMPLGARLWLNMPICRCRAMDRFWKLTTVRKTTELTAMRTSTAMLALIGYITMAETLKDAGIKESGHLFTHERLSTALTS